MKNSTAIFPNIDYKYWLSQYDWNNLGTVPRMITLMQNQGCISPDISAENIASEIKREIQGYFLGENTSNLKNICVLIQTWGGSSARIHSPRIYNDWEPNSYELIYTEFVKHITTRNFHAAFVTLLSINGIGASFVPKHICFWSGNGDRLNGIPILDDVIGKLIYARTANQLNNNGQFYGQFISDFESFANTKGMTPSEVEMALFAFSGHYWSTSNTATKSFYPHINTKSNDYQIAYLIADRYSENN